MDWRQALFVSVCATTIVLCCVGSGVSAALATPEELLSLCEKEGQSRLKRRVDSCTNCTCRASNFVSCKQEVCTKKGGCDSGRRLQEDQCCVCFGNDDAKSVGKLKSVKHDGMLGVIGGLGLGCAVRDWSPWTSCSATCGKGFQVRDTIRLLSLPGGRKRCIRHARTRRCDVKRKCPAVVECDEKPWSSWGKCSETCRGGRQYRHRIVLRVAKDNTATCASDVMQQACNKDISCKKTERPKRISGLITGTVNNISMDTTRYAAQSDKSSGSTMATIGGVPDSLAKGLGVLVPLLWPTYWLNVPMKDSTTFLSDGFTLTGALFKAVGSIIILQKRLHVEFEGNGIDQHGQARIDIHVQGQVPTYPEAAQVQAHAFQEVYRWINNDLVVSGQSRVSINRSPLTVSWNYTIQAKGLNSVKSLMKDDRAQVVDVSGIRLFHRAAVKQLYYMARVQGHIVERKTNHREQERKDPVPTTTSAVLLSTNPTVSQRVSDLPTMSSRVSSATNSPSTTLNTTSLTVSPSNIKSRTGPPGHQTPSVSSHTLTTTQPVTTAAEKTCEKYLLRPCQFGGACRWNGTHATCDCSHLECGRSHRAFVCASDGQMYMSACHVRIQSCTEQKQLSITSRTVCRGQPSFVIRPPQTLKVSGGRRLHLKCLAYGNPKVIKMVWKRNGRRMHTNKRMHINSNNRLTIFKTRSKDSGRYECIAFNRLGKIRTVMQLTVFNQVKSRIPVTTASVETSPEMPLSASRTTNSLPTTAPAFSSAHSSVTAITTQANTFSSEQRTTQVMPLLHTSENHISSETVNDLYTVVTTSPYHLDREETTPASATHHPSRENKTLSATSTALQNSVKQEEPITKIPVSTGSVFLEETSTMSSDQDPASIKPTLLKELSETPWTASTDQSPTLVVTSLPTTQPDLKADQSSNELLSTYKSPMSSAAFLPETRTPPTQLPAETAIVTHVLASDTPHEASVPPLMISEDEPKSETHVSSELRTNVVTLTGTSPTKQTNILTESTTRITQAAPTSFNAPIRARNDGPPSMSVLLHNTTVTRGENVLLPCQAYGDPLPKISWILHLPNDNIVLSPSNQTRGRHGTVKWQILHHSTLQLSRVVGYPYGNGIRRKQIVLTCRAENIAGHTEQHVVLQVRDQRPGKVVVHHHGNVSGFLHLECRASYHNIHWQKDSSPLKTSPRVLLIHHHLFVLNISEKDSGNYTCSREDRHLLASQAIKVKGVHSPRIASLPHRMLKSMGQSLTLTCTASGNPLPYVLWRHEGKAITNQSTASFFEGQPMRQVVSEVSASSHLQLKSLSMRSAGLYTCEARNTAGVDRRSIRLTVQAAPVLIFTPTNVTITPANQTQQTVILPCSASGFPKPTIIWLRDGKLLKNSTNEHLVLASDGSLILKVENTTAMCKYTCIAYNNAGATSRTVWVMYEEFPSTTVFPHQSEVDVIEGSVLTLPCESTGFPRPHIEWLKDGESLSDIQVEHFVSSNNSLVLVNVRKEHEGRYMCCASNRLAQATDWVIVQVRASPSRSRPVITDLANQTVTAGQHVLLDCPVTGHPQPAVTWYFNNKDLSSLKAFANGSVLLPNVGDWWAGQWVCVARNEHGEDRQEFSLAVHSHPDFLVTPDDVITYIGQPVQFTCSSRGIPTPKISWVMDNSSMHDDSYSVVVEDGYSTLTIATVSWHHNGSVTCIATNEAGTKSMKAMLVIKVSDPPKPHVTTDTESTLSVGATFMLHCITDTMKLGHYPAGPESVTWFHNGKEVPGSRSEHVTQDNGANLTVSVVSVATGGIYTCQVSSLAGNGTAQTVIHVIERPSLRRVTKNLSKPPKKRILLHCRPPYAFRKAAVNWVKLPGHDIISSNRTFRITRAKALRFRLNENTAGLYQCSVHVAGVMLSHASLVSVKGKRPAPQLIHPLRSQVVAPGNSIRWPCPITSNPLPAYQWRKNNVRLTQTTWPRVEGNKLVFRHAEESDSGNYTCVAVNKAGRAETDAQLTVTQVTCRTEQGEFPMGRSWMASSCQMCTCQPGGLVTCEKLQCPQLHCVHQIPLPGACCPICKECDRSNSSKSCSPSLCDGQSCPAYPAAKCHVTPCEPCHVYFTVNNKRVNCTVAECRDEIGQIKQNGSTWNTSLCSHTCHCQQGLTRCQPITCPPCTEGKSLQVPGQCCPICQVGWSSCLLRPWSQWSACSSSCGRGSQQRYRHLQSAVGSADCRGKLRQNKPCQGQPCKNNNDKNQQGNRRYDTLIVFNTGQSPTIKCRYANRRLKVNSWYHGDKKNLTPVQTTNRLLLLSKYKFLRLKKAQPSDSSSLFTCDGVDGAGRRHLVTTKLLHAAHLKTH